MKNEMLALLQDIYDEVEPMLGMGKVADYILRWLRLIHGNLAFQFAIQTVK